MPPAGSSAVPRAGRRPDAPERAFADRYREQLVRRPLRLVTACVTTALVPALAPALLAGSSTEARASSVVSPPPPPPPPPAAPAVPTPIVVDDERGWARAARAAAATCPGLPAVVLLAIGYVETRLGADVGPSPAGARGPMQFLPSTWVSYSADGDGDGKADIMNTDDALHAAARLLCANGGGEPERLPSALWNYNHSHDYVDEVLRVAGLSR